LSEGSTLLIKGLQEGNAYGSKNDHCDELDGFHAVDACDDYSGLEDG
jgi:hypothetical protein